MPPREPAPNIKIEKKKGMDPAERAAIKERIYGGSGRTIEGVPEVRERFTVLEGSKDYDLIEENSAVESNQQVKDYFLFINPTKGTQTRTISAPHWRAVTTPDFRGSVDLGEGRKDFFFEANTKGVGYLKPSALGASFDDIYDTWIRKEEGEGEHMFNEKILGLSDVESFKGAKGDDDLMEKTMHLARAGLRTEVYWGVAQIKRAPFQGELTSVEELRTRGVIPKRKRFEPAMAVRLFKTNSRIEEAHRDPERRVALFRKAFDAYNKEEKAHSPEAARPLIMGKAEDERTFFKVFAERLGKNIAVFMNEGFYSLALHASNITLAAEIADAESFKHHSKEKEPTLKQKYAGVRHGHVKDARDLCYGLRFLLMAGKEANLHTSPREVLQEAFMEGFLSNLNQDSLKKQGTNAQKAIEWVTKISKAVIVDRQNLPSLLHYSIDDWPIEVED